MNSLQEWLNYQCQAEMSTEEWINAEYTLQ